MCFTPLDSAHILYCTRVLCVCVCVCTATHLALFRDKRFHILVWFLHPLFPHIHLSLSSLNYAHLSHSFIKSYHSDCGGGDPAHYVVCLASAISSRDSPQTPASHWAGGGNQSRRGGNKKKNPYFIISWRLQVDYAPGLSRLRADVRSRLCVCSFLFFNFFFLRRLWPRSHFAPLQ